MANQLDRRAFFAVCSAAGLGSTLFPGVLWAAVHSPQSTVHSGPEPQKKEEPAKPKAITREMIDSAAAVAGISIADEYKDMMLRDLNDQVASYEALRKLELKNSEQLALTFDPVLPGAKKKFETAKRPPRLSKLEPAWLNTRAPKDLEQLAFATVRELGERLRARQFTSVNLTEMYLARLERYNRLLKFGITLTTERALDHARAADRDLARGKLRSPLHGIPWGAKDLLAVKGYPTTWGAGGFEKQVIDEDATVVQRLDAAGAVLVAKLTLGALAMGDKWFGGMTRNPWRPQDQGSSGSSAGSASATAAGCVGFAIGSETLGSISSPSTRCGTTGLRPTFGFVPRTGAMTLCWTWDKLGPITRAVEDCALVMSAIHGPDQQDLDCIHPAAFNWDASFDWRKLRVGYLKSAFDPPKQQENEPTAPPEKPETELSAEERKKKEEERLDAAERKLSREYDRRFLAPTLAALDQMGVKLTAVELPKDFPYGPCILGLSAEAAAAFDDLTRSGRDRLLTQQSIDDWPNGFRVARFIPAVDYLQANRARLRLMRELARIFEQVDVIVTPTTSTQLIATNITGHPAVIVPNGFRGADAPQLRKYEDGGGPGTPVSLTFLGDLFSDARLCAFARAYQEKTGWHRKHPELPRE
ncbi:MAG TPA: amidase [Terriglobales bacterium]|jgi:Asp-tRNA(Asn)/Glu-tRNA(Gln) amidotransferase A subunit family amidase|nr:amidase [Terriglobales bacterium]